MKAFCINIRETLEQQVDIEAESVESALKIAEKNWKQGEYILGAEQFTGVSFTALPGDTT